ncbi:MAG: GNAT family N-acetyltransferase [Candidatus Polarisedimenticolaceae bacterium]|nr:GNAT family N-acetyltransferase [Candidatus Polarisedimenticolaceae bacterium]
MNNIVFRYVKTQQDLQQLRDLRTLIYITEEGLDEDLAFDNYFHIEHHCIALEDGVVIGSVSYFTTNRNSHLGKLQHYVGANHKGTIGSIGKLMAIPSRRGIFLSAALMMLGYELLMQHDPNLIILSVFNHKLEKISMYDRLGFYVAGTESVGHMKHKTIMKLDDPKFEHKRRVRERVFRYYRNKLENIDAQNLPIARVISEE